MPQPMRPRGSLTFSKPPLSLGELVDRLIDRGLEVPDRQRAHRYLRHIGYYRLSPYTIPFRQGGGGQALHEGTSFDDLLDLYVFDRALRLIVMDAIERAEVAVRAALTDHMSMRYSDAHWYLTPTHFGDHGRHARLVKIIRETCEKRLRGTPDAGEDSLVHRSALEHYLTTNGVPRTAAVLAHERDADHRSADQHVAKSEAALRQDRGRQQPRTDRARPRVLDADLRPGAQHLRPPRPALERGARRVPGDPDLAHGALACGGWRATGAVEKAALPRSRFAAVGPLFGLAAQRLGPSASRPTQRPASDELARNGRPRGLGRRSVLESAAILTRRARARRPARGGKTLLEPR